MLPSPGLHHPRGRSVRVRPGRPIHLFTCLIAGLVLGLLPMTLSPTASAATPVDLGDAPVHFDKGHRGPARAELGGPRLGTSVSADHADARTGFSTHASNAADADRGDDGVAALAPFPVGRLARFSTKVAVSDVDRTARLCGWVDFDLNGTFGRTERACTEVSAGSTSTELAWSGRPAAAGRSYLRLRIGSDAAKVAEPTGPSDGEIEDYRVSFVNRELAALPDLSLTKTVSPNRMTQVGEVLTYTLVATNTGTVPLSGVRITDELPGLSDLSCDPAMPASLEPDDELSCTTTRVVTQDDLDFGSIINIAQVSAEAPGGDADDDTDDISAIADVTVDAVLRPRLTLTGESDRKKARRGNRVRVNLVVTNPGNVKLTRLKFVTDLDGVTCKPASRTLLPGAQLNCAGTYRVTKADARRGKVVVRTAAHAERPYGESSRPSDDVVAKSAVPLKVVKISSTTAVPEGPAGGQDPAAEHPAQLPETGGPSALLGVLSLAMLTAGGIALRASRRR